MGKVNELKTLEELIEQLELPPRPLQTTRVWLVVFALVIVLMGVLCYGTFLAGAWIWFSLSLLVMGVAGSGLFFQEQIQLTEQGFTSWSLWKWKRYEVQWAEIEEISLDFVNGSMSIHAKSQIWNTIHPNNWQGVDQPYMTVLLFKKIQEHNVTLRVDGILC